MPRWLLYIFLVILIATAVTLPFIIGWAKHDPIGGLVLVAILGVVFAGFFIYRMRHGYFPGDEHLLLQSPSERRRNRIKAWSLIAAMFGLIVVMVVYVDSNAKPERKVLRQIEDYFARH